MNTIRTLLLGLFAVGLLSAQSVSGGGATITLTTIGSSGAATLGNGVLNIPIYVGGAGSSIFSSYQFGNQTAITTTSNYLQTTYPNIFVTTQTGSGTMLSPYVDAITNASQSANCIMAGPASGSAAAWGCRSLVIADLPTGILLSANNLSDVASAATSRTNLGLGTAATQNTGTSGANLGLLNANLTFSGTNAYGTPTSITLTNALGLPAGGLASVSADNIFGNFTGSSAIPGTQAIPACANDGAHALVYASHTLTCEPITASGGLNQLTGDVTAGPGTGSQAATVIGIKGVPFCTGYTPTNGEIVEYTTGGSPNPCYTATSVSGTGTSLNVNGGSALTSANLNSTTPAAGTGFSNAAVQISGNNVSLEVQCGGLLTTFGNGCAGDTTQILTKAIGTAGTPWSLQATSSGAGVTIVASAPTGMVSYTDNSFFNMKLTDSNSGASCTLNIGTLGPIALVKLVGVTVTACAAGDIQENEPILLNYTSNGGLGGAAAFLYTPQGASGATGTVTSFSAGNLSPLFTTSVATATSTPALSFTLSNAAQNSVLAGPPTGGAGAPTYQTAPTLSAANMTNLPITLTTTGSGASTYTQSTNTLNIPVSGSGGSGQINYPIADQTQLLPVGLSQQTAVTVTGTTAATTVLGVFAGRNSIPAGTMLASGSGLKTVRVHGVGTVTTAATSFGVTLTFLLGGNALSSITVPTTLSLTGAGFDFDYEFTVSGLTTAVGGGKACGNIGTSNAFACGYASSASITGLNFAVSQNVDIQVTPQSSSDSVTINELSISPVFTL
jgi:hypothetical protein